MTHSEFIDLQRLEPLAKIHYEATHKGMLWSNLSAGECIFWLEAMALVLEEIKRNASQ